VRLLLLRLVLAAFLAAAVRAAPALASDIGPLTAVTAIRHDLPLLLAAPLKNLRGTPTIDWVVADKTYAVAMWQAGQNQGIVALQLRSGRWWWHAAAVTTSYQVGSWTRMYTPGDELTDCGPQMPGPPSAEELLSQSFIDKGLAQLLYGRLKSAALPKVMTIADCVSFTVRGTQGGYDAVFTPKPDVSDDGVQFQLSGGAAAGRQSPERSTASPIYGFDLAAWPYNKRIARSLLAQRGSVISVWFPFVLDLHESYSLNLSNVSPELRAIYGRIKDNVLRFSLPPFVIRTGSVARGAIYDSSMRNQ
jgi:hypothetical protein